MAGVEKTPASQPTAVAAPSPTPQPTAPAPAPLTWQAIEADDYPTYIANLRKIGCPEETIQDIIKADVKSLCAQAPSGGAEATREQQILAALFPPRGATLASTMTSAAKAAPQERRPELPEQAAVGDAAGRGDQKSMASATAPAVPTGPVWRHATSSPSGAGADGGAPGQAQTKVELRPVGGGAAATSWVPSLVRARRYGSYFTLEEQQFRAIHGEAALLQFKAEQAQQSP